MASKLNGAFAPKANEHPSHPATQTITAAIRMTFILSAILRALVLAEKGVCYCYDDKKR